MGLSKLLTLILLFATTNLFASKERIFNELVKQGVDSASARVFTSQAFLESNSLKNGLTKNHNNPFAILHDKNRKTTSLGPFGYAEKRGGYASYASLEAATRDFLYFLDYWGVSRIQHSCSLYSLRLKHLISPKSGKVRQYYTSSQRLYAKALWVRYKQLWL